MGYVGAHLFLFCYWELKEDASIGGIGSGPNVPPKKWWWHPWTNYEMHYLSKEGEEVDGWMKLDERTLHHNCCCSHFQVEHTDSWAHGSNCSNWLPSWCPQCMHVASHESMCFVMSLIILIEQFHLQKKKPPPKKGFGFRV